MFQPRIPADVIDVKMRAHDEIDVGERQASGLQVLLVGRVLHHVPERPVGARLVVADAAVDHDVVVLGAHDIALDTQHHLARRGIDEARLEPGLVLGQHLLRQFGEKHQRIEERHLLLDHAVDGDVAEHEMGFHRGLRAVLAPFSTGPVIAVKPPANAYFLVSHLTGSRNAISFSVPRMAKSP